MRVEFTIDCHGQNAVPYLRMTQGQTRLVKARNLKSKSLQKLVDRIRRYMDWKTYVLMTFKNAARQQGMILNTKEKNYVDIMIWYANKKHADSDNVIKGILDAIFDNDKYVAGSFDFDYDKDRPRVEVIIHDGEEKI